MLVDSFARDKKKKIHLFSFDPPHHSLMVQYMYKEVWGKNVH